MAEINLCNSDGRDAVVNSDSVGVTRKVRWLDQKNRQATNVRILKSTIDCDLDAIQEQLEAGDEELEKVGQALIEGDPEIDVERVGSYLRDTSRVFIDEDREIVHKVQHWEIVRNPDGSERERRRRNLLPPNLAAEVPLRWSGRLIDKAEACRKYVFGGMMQITHINGLTYDFLFNMAKDLEEKNSLMLTGAGPKANQPLILRRGGVGYRGFLEGRTQGDRYCLVLHLSNMELKVAK